jgi:oligopeptidase B
VWRHRIGSDPATDALVFHETDDAFYVELDKSRSEQMIIIESGEACGEGCE